MKYIRTNDGIYKYADYLGVFNGKRYALMDDAKGNRITMCQEPKELCKVADTIEELCDCFVDYCEEDDSHLVSTEKPIRRRNHEIYGAIWTDKGLIYVAKINDKGELELL